MIQTELPQSVVNTISKKYNMTPEAVKDLYRGWWKWVKDFIEEQDLSVTGQYNKVSDIVVPHIGKFHFNIHKQIKYNHHE